MSENDRALGSDLAASKRVLLQLATRAIRRVHLDAQLLSLGEDSGDDESVRRINQGMGVEIAPETTVRDALAQEFNASKLGHGWKLRAGRSPAERDSDSRYFGVIDREVAYLVDGDDCSLHVDLQYRRVSGPGQPATAYPVGPVELKRARLFDPDLKLGVALAGRFQRQSIRRDIRKLARFVRADRAGKLVLPFKTTPHTDPAADMIHPQILVWGLGVEQGPVHFMNEIFTKVAVCGCRPLGSILYEWIPVSWAGRDTPQVSQWIWVAIATLDVLDEPCSDPDCACQAPTRRRRATIVRPK